MRRIGLEVEEIGVEDLAPRELGAVQGRKRLGETGSLVEYTAMAHKSALGGARASAELEPSANVAVADEMFSHDLLEVENFSVSASLIQDLKHVHTFMVLLDFQMFYLNHCIFQKIMSILFHVLFRKKVFEAMFCDHCYERLRVRCSPARYIVLNLSGSNCIDASDVLKDRAKELETL